MHRWSQGEQTPSEEEEDGTPGSAAGMASVSPDAGNPEPADERRRLQLQQASRQSRKRQKREATLCSSELAAVRQEIQEIQKKLDTLSPSKVDARTAVNDHVDLKERISFLRRKLMAHHHWMDDLRKLLVSAPLLDYALRVQRSEARAESPHSSEGERKEDGGHSSPPRSGGSLQETQQDAKMVDEWRQQTAGTIFSPILIAKHVHAAVKMSQINAEKLLDEFADPACAFGVQFASRGWAIAANLDSILLTFRASRVVPSASAGNIAAAIWRSIQQDDVLRTFAPVVLDAAIVYECDTAFRCVTERMIQVEATGQVKSIVLIDSMKEHSRDGSRYWQIAVESCDDPCLIAFAAEAKAAEGTTPPMSPVAPAVSTRNNASTVDIVIAAKCFLLGANGGVAVQFAGSIRHDSTSLIPAKSHVDLVQYLVNFLPVYEDIQLLSRT